MPTVPFGMGLSALLKEASGETYAAPTGGRGLLLPGLQAQRESVYLGQARR